MLAANRNCVNVENKVKPITNPIVTISIIPHTIFFRFGFTKRDEIWKNFPKKKTTDFRLNKIKSSFLEAFRHWKFYETILTRISS